MKDLTTQIQNTIDWMSKVVDYWQKLEDDIYNNKSFWQDTYHSRTKQDWQDFVDSVPHFQEQFPEIFDKHANFNTKIIEKRLRAKEPVIKKYMKEYNTPVFAVVMAFKDIFHEILGIPVRKIDKTPPPSDLKPITASKGPKMTPKDQYQVSIFENLFEIKD